MGIEKGFFQNPTKKDDRGKELSIEEQKSRNEILHDFMRVIDDQLIYLMREVGATREEAVQILKRTFEYQIEIFGGDNGHLMPKRLGYNPGFNSDWEKEIGITKKE